MFDLEIYTGGREVRTVGVGEGKRECKRQTEGPSRVDSVS